MPAGHAHAGASNAKGGVVTEMVDNRDSTPLSTWLVLAVLVVSTIVCQVPSCMPSTRQFNLYYMYTLCTLLRDVHV